jgi:hypothetical protein
MIRLSRLCVAWAAIGILLFAGARPVSGAWLTPDQLYIDPADLPAGEYPIQYFDDGYVMSLSDVADVRILPLLTEDAGDYYYSPGVDYTADLTGNTATLTFQSSGPYTIRATGLDGGVSVYALSIGVQERSIRVVPRPGARANAPRLIPKPDGGDKVVVDANSFPDMEAGDYGGKPKMIKILTWADVTAALKSSTTPIHVELDGHGEPGKFYWNGQLVLENGSAQTQKWLDSMKGHINRLTFISCSVGQGAVGDSFLSMVASTLGSAGAYTQVIGTIGSPGQKKWYIENNGTYKDVPEPVTVILLLFGSICLTRRRAA